MAKSIRLDDFEGSSLVSNFTADPTKLIKGGAPSK
jgi:hypothetical protein